MGEWDHYARLPYQGRAHQSAHIDRMATVAALFGIPAPPIDRARVLELGCADGTNLLNMAAYLPNSHFVGVDAFQGHIDTGQRIARSIGVQNITLHTGDIRDLPRDLGTYDYIVAHGVYSWVDAPTRDALMRAIRARLRPEGLALVSYNTLPGWSLYQPVRDLMRWCTRGMADGPAEVATARSSAHLLRSAIPHPDMPRARFLDGLLNELDNVSDDYIYHEYLEPTNHPVWFHEFASHAQQAGLQYVGESAFQSMLADNFPDHIQQTLHRLTNTILEFEQYRDFLCQRRFRSSIVTHCERSLPRTVTLQPILSLAISAPLMRSEDTYTHRHQPDCTVEVSRPLHHHALSLLAGRYPEALPFPALVAQCSQALDQPPDAPFQTELAALIMSLFRKGIAELYRIAPPVTATIAPHPTAPPLVRWQASQDRIITSPRHEMFRLNPLEAAVTTLLDGSRAPHDIATLIAPRLTTAALPASSELSNHALALQIVSQTLQRLSQDGLLLQC